MTDEQHRLAQELQHRVIEQAKASHRAGGGDMTFEQLLAFHAPAIVGAAAEMHWMVGERNGVWSFDVWHEAADDDASTTRPLPFTTN